MKVIKNIKILLVDDHKLIRDGVNKLLLDYSHFKIVGQCSNGEEAITFLNINSDVDIVLMDINMPILNGIDATEIINKLYPKINVIALTMHSEEAYIIKMIKAGALGYILKDSSKEILVEAIESVAKNEKYYSYEVSMKLITMFLDEDKPKETKLSDREMQVLILISKGLSNGEIAKKLLISHNTVDVHRRNILDKLELKNTVELVTYALNNNLIETELH